MRTRSVVALVMVAVLLAGSIGAAIGLFFAPTPVPEVIIVADGEQTLPVTQRQIVDSRTVPATALIAKSRDTTGNAVGVVRRSDCKVGEAIDSGKSPFEVGGSDLLAINLAAPPFRTIKSGDRGDDVKDFQAAMKALGYSVEEDGYFSTTMANQVAELWKSIGVTELYEVPLERLIWLPSEQITPSTCRVEVGDDIEPGAALFTAGGALKALRVDLPPTALSGDRVAVLGEVKAPISKDGLIEAPTFLKAYAGERQYKQYQAGEGADLTVETELAQPVTAVGVPSSSLYNVLETTACLVDNGQPTPVSIVASELGSTFVVADPLPTLVSVPAPTGAAPCE